MSCQLLHSGYVHQSVDITALYQKLSRVLANCIVQQFEFALRETCDQAN